MHAKEREIEEGREKDLKSLNTKSSVLKLQVTRVTKLKSLDAIGVRR
jgi:hypothetical protein